MELKIISGVFLTFLAYLLRNSTGTAELICDIAFLTTGQIIVKDRYPFEEHNVITDDGYILVMHRIPNYGGIPILLVHGLLDASHAWVLLGRDRALAYQLHNLGYDIWLGNTRGNRYSRDHLYLDSKNEINTKYWDFSFHELGKYDLPAMIDYIIGKTGKPKIHYVGHSQGTTSFFAMCSLRPDYNDKVTSAHTLAPVVFLEYAKSPLIVALSGFDLTQLFNLIGNREVSKSNFISDLAEQVVCNEVEPLDVCQNLMLLLFGWGSTQTSDEMIQCLMGHAPNGHSTKQLIHYGQIMKYNNFARFRKNFLPTQLYDLSKVTAKVVLYYSLNDWLNDEKDVDRLHAELPNVYKKYLVPEPTFNHLDFTYGDLNNNELLYNELCINIQNLT